MENIFEHTISDEEIRQLNKMIPGRKISDKHSYVGITSKDIKYADLYRLYSIRGEKQNAKSFLNKINDDILKYLLIN